MGDTEETDHVDMDALTERSRGGQPPGRERCAGGGRGVGRPGWVGWVRWCVGCAAWVAWVAISTRISRSADARFSESGLKAAYLINFTAFVDWPPAAGGAGEAPLVIGVQNRPEFARLLRELVQRKGPIGRPRVVRDFSTVAEVAGCDVVFVAAGDEGRPVLKAVEGRPVLTVGDSAGFLESGGMIEFARVGENILFDIHQRAAESCGLRVSSKVLGLARRVVRPHEGLLPASRP